MRMCCVPNCASSSLGRRLFSFPTEYERYSKWVKAVNREDLLKLNWKTVRKIHKVCVSHFCVHHRVTKGNRTMLKKIAYPTLLLSKDPKTNGNETVSCCDNTESELASSELTEAPPIRVKRKYRKRKKKSEEVEEEQEECVNFDDVCRVCLSTNDQLTDIQKVSFEGLSVQDVFEQYIAIKIDMDDDLPKQLCTMCLYELCRVYLFVNNCREADAKLKELVSSIQTDDKKVSQQPEIVASENCETEWNFQDNNDNVSNTDNLRKPLKVTEPGPPFTCDNCSTSFDTLAEIKLHRTLLKHYKVRQYLCRFCNSSEVYTYRRWKTHVRVHTGEKPYECHICGKRFSGHSNRRRHILTHSGVKPYNCNFCGKGYSQSTNLKYHKLKEHVEAEKGHFECEHCQRVFPTNTSLKHHSVVHFDKKFLCNECGKSFHYRSQFNKHMETHTRVRRYQCEICSKVFAKPLTFNLHKRTHTGYKPYECQYCQRRFTQKAHLVTHTRTHTGERPYICPYCHKTFALNGNLTVHIRKHTGENPYVCDICTKGFADSSSLKTHRKKHASEWLDQV